MARLCSQVAWRISSHLACTWLIGRYMVTKAAPPSTANCHARWRILLHVHAMCHAWGYMLDLILACTQAAVPDMHGVIQQDQLLLSRLQALLQQVSSLP